MMHNDIKWDHDTTYDGQGELDTPKCKSQVQTPIEFFTDDQDGEVGDGR